MTTMVWVAAVAWIQSVAGEVPHAMWAAIKKERERERERKTTYKLRTQAQKPSFQPALHLLAVWLWARCLPVYLSVPPCSHP